MSTFHPIRGQAVSRDKVGRARELRRDMTPAERVLWRELRQLRPLGWVFRRQQVIAGFIVDFYCHRAQLVVEVDGGIHEHQADYDKERDIVLTTHGLRVLRFTNHDVAHHLPNVIQKIGATCDAQH